MTKLLAKMLLKIAHRGGQNHKFTRDEIGVRYKEVFQSTLW